MPAERGMDGVCVPPLSSSSVTLPPPLPKTLLASAEHSGHQSGQWLLSLPASIGSLGQPRQGRCFVAAPGSRAGGGHIGRGALCQWTFALQLKALMLAGKQEETRSFLEGDNLPAPPPVPF